MKISGSPSKNEGRIEKYMGCLIKNGKRAMMFERERERERERPTMFKRKNNSFYGPYF